MTCAPGQGDKEHPPPLFPRPRANTTTSPAPPPGRLEPRLVRLYGGCFVVAVSVVFPSLHCFILDTQDTIWNKVRGPGACTHHPPCHAACKAMVCMQSNGLKKRRRESEWSLIDAARPFCFIYIAFSYSTAFSHGHGSTKTGLVKYIDNSIGNKHEHDTTLEVR